MSCLANIELGGIGAFKNYWANSTTDCILLYILQNKFNFKILKINLLNLILGKKIILRNYKDSSICNLIAKNDIDIEILSSQILIKSGYLTKTNNNEVINIIKEKNKEIIIYTEEYFCLPGKEIIDIFIKDYESWINYEEIIGNQGKCDLKIFIKNYKSSLNDDKEFKKLINYLIKNLHKNYKEIDF